MTNLLITIAVIALIDSVNPNAVAVQLYLLSTPRPVKRSIAFILGDFSAAWIAGMLIALGISQLIAQVFNRLGSFIFVLQFVSGIILIVLGYYLNRFTNSTIAKRPRSLKPSSTFLFGLTMALLEAPTALPYLIAIEKIRQSNPTLLQLMLLLLFYDFIFVLPLIALLLLYLVLQNRTSQLDRIQAFVNHWFPIAFRIVLIGLGAVLIADCVFRLFGRSLL